MKGDKMKKDWMNIIVKIADGLDDTTQITCPNCGEHGIDYIYVGDAETRIGYLQVWSCKCLKGTYISRAIASDNAKFAAFDTDL